MTSELDFIAALRTLARSPAARGLDDDAAVLEVGGARLVLTHDMIVEGVHFLPTDPPEDIAWKLLAVNLSDLAAKGATPLGALLGYALAPDDDWNAAFLRGLEAAFDAFATPLLGGDTVAAPGPRSFGLTAIGSADVVPSRAGAQNGDDLWVTGTIGDAGIGLAIAKGDRDGPADLLDRYRRPQPRLAEGRALAPLVSAMMDVSDGLLIDAARLARASGVKLDIALDRVPLSASLEQCDGGGRAARLRAATAGDDYELLFTAPEAASQAITALGFAVKRIGRASAGEGIRLGDGDGPVPLPPRLGYEH